MKAFKYIMALAVAPMLWACSADEGAEPGSDPNPVVTLYSYAPTDPDLDLDSDLIVRFVTNNKVTSVKYLLAPSADFNGLSEQQLVSKVESEGKSLENVKGDAAIDITLKNIRGEYSVAAVANGAALGNTVDFVGIGWNTLKHGTFIYNSDRAPVEETEAILQVCETDPLLYRVKGVFGGVSVKMNILEGYTGEDEDGAYRYFRVAPTPTNWTYGNYGTISVRDIGYWQGDVTWVTEGGYESGLYEDGSAFFMLQWYVSAGSLGFQYSYFVPND